ncbi:DWNN domain, a CCHC-type zinc finger [Melia azedarach]|uniref:DWNN domain, a CCHC-type zinc finger n=1 Tax=Melia azedarach TaxID=155640 RepID=A0ACC1YEM5_MELAZ|nr:DWNN domain, a CCHC-type zinc finger [Melia azedarach]
MAVYYKFKSARDYDSIPIDGPFISLCILKQKFFESKRLGRGTDVDIQVTNAQTNEEYLDETMLIPKNTSVLIRRVPGFLCRSIVIEKEPKVKCAQPEKNDISADSTAVKYTDDQFGTDLYAIPHEAPLVQSSNPLDVDEDSKIKALVDTPAMNLLFSHGRGFDLERRTPPRGYVCHRCNVPGHFIKHCPTNGDPKYDVKRLKNPTGIPKSMLIATSAVLRPNIEASFEKEIGGLRSSTCSTSDFPPELRCPLCEEVMKDAVFASKCCFRSSCDKSIRNHIITKAMCVCGAKAILADHLLPNKTLRDTINRILQSGNSSVESAGSTSQVQDMESARCSLQPELPSPTLYTALNGAQKPSSPVDHKDTRIPKQTVDEVVGRVQPAVAQASQGSSASEVETGEEKKEKKKIKVGMPANELQWKTPQNVRVESCVMPLGPSAYNYNPYWTGMQYAAPLAAGAMPNYMGYMMPVVSPQRDLAEEFGMEMNVQDLHHRGNNHYRSMRSAPEPLPRPSKRKSDHRDPEYVYDYHDRQRKRHHYHHHHCFVLPDT